MDILDHVCTQIVTDNYEKKHLKTVLSVFETPVACKHFFCFKPILKNIDFFYFPY